MRLAGFDVQAFASGEALLAHGVRDDACLVLDVDLPGTDGVRLTRTLGDAGHHLPTIFITALEADAVAATLSGLDPVAVLYKPFDKQVLLDALARASAGISRQRQQGRRP